MPSTKVDGRPSFQFYPDDWLSEHTLRLCDLRARGLWIDLICHMWTMPERGVLRVNGHPLSLSELARLVGRPVQEVEAGLKQLREAAAFSLTPDGCVFSRRMVRDDQQRRAEREAAHALHEARARAGSVGGRSKGQANAKQKASKTEAKNQANAKQPASSPHDLNLIGTATCDTNCKQNGSTDQAESQAKQASSSSSSSSSTSKKEEKRILRGATKKLSLPAVVPPELSDLELYREDKKLCAKWGPYYASWQREYEKRDSQGALLPGSLDVLAQVHRAHQWELEHSTQRKKDRVKYLGGWLRREQDRPRSNQGTAVNPTVADQEAQTERVLARLKADREAREGVKP